MLSVITLRLVGAWLSIGEFVKSRQEQFARERERGDENITKALYAALGLGMGALIAGAITAFVNGKLPLIGGH